MPHVFTQCGGGYDILLILNDSPLPPKLSQVPRVTVSTCVATRRDGSYIEEDPLDEYGAVCPTDSMLDQVLGEMTPIAECRVFLDATASETFGSILGGDVKKKLIVRCRLSKNWLLISDSAESVGDKAAALFSSSEDIDWSAGPKDNQKVAPSNGGAVRTKEITIARSGSASVKSGAVASNGGAVQTKEIAIARSGSASVKSGAVASNGGAAQTKENATARSGGGSVKFGDGTSQPSRSITLNPELIWLCFPFGQSSCQYSIPKNCCCLKKPI